jgi:S-adenosylmethionine:tRNA ribosyltransferase-isomerase
MNATFVVPAELEAHEPPEYRGIPRDHVEMLVSDRRSGNIEHSMFVDLPSWLRRGDLLVVNDSATIAAALHAHKTDRTPLDLHLSAPFSGSVWIAEPRGAVEAFERLVLPGGGFATLLAPVSGRSKRLWYVRLELPEPVDEYLIVNGRPIRYKYVTREFPLEAYQTIFARVPGSAEMPSAGRPFTPRILDDLARRGVEIASITLHCGVSSAETHEPPQPERFEVSFSTVKRIARTRENGGRVIAVGTTVVRALESALCHGSLVSSSGWTDLVVTPQRGVHIVDGILTGLHEPQASHLEMLEAFLPHDDLMAAYRAAIERHYLWHEFGDVHLILSA